MAPSPMDAASAPDPATVLDLPDGVVAYTEFDRRRRVGGGPEAVVSEAVVSVDGTGHRVELTEIREKASVPAREFVAVARQWRSVADHDHVAGVLDWGKKPRPWIATEFLPGGTLTDRAGAVSLDHACWIGVTVAAALRYAHEEGLVHGALTPDSVRFQPTATEWDFPKVTGWGLDRVVDAGNRGSDPGGVYLAPEQVDASVGSVDERTDVYRLGVVLYELVTGESPYLNPDPGPDAVVAGAPVPPSTVDPALPTDVDDVLLAALEKDPGERYASVVQFRRHLVDLFESVRVEGRDDETDDVVEAVSDDLDVDLRTFPMFDDDRAEWTAACPSCGRSINNTLSSFAAHWAESPWCSGPPPSPPPGRSTHSEDEWEAVLAVADAAAARHDEGDGGTTDPDHPLWTALAVDGTDVVEVGGVRVESADGTFPWLDYPRRGWRVPCPVCDETVFNARSALMDHWAAASDCDGPPDDFRTV